MSTETIEESTWFEDRTSKELSQLAERIQVCIDDLESPVKLPVAVPSGREIRGVLTRTGHIISSINVNVLLTGKKMFTIKGSSPKKVPELAVLKSGLRQLLVLISREDVNPQTVLQILNSTIANSTTKAEHDKFPNKIWTPQGVPSGVCADIIPNHGKISLIIHSYQDRAENQFYATNSVTAESNDPVLAKIYEELSDIQLAVYRIVRNSYILKTS